MSVENEPHPETPTCSVCEDEMELRAEGVEKAIPIIGTEVEFRQYRCPECGQGARFERSGSDEEWSRAAM
ncbi:hypothetical protein [Halosolutus gelatinilyticus]|uniref:hypothetical protein n=1 Tax=Halosolutus gelatinilyticus TaxID=2931975 RepID=UPI001FF57B6E|nr:hypothetical protein [Halosolutus gelatinilyticus]